MKEYLKKLPKEIQNALRLASAISSHNNVSAYLVGGFVRDFLLGVANFDLDIVVEADGIAFAQELAKRLKVKLTSHKRFGTATLFLANNLKIDIASARAEYYPYPASLPIVRKGNIRDDLKRRDFTINAIAIDIRGANYGRLVDFFNGRDDLNHKKIRILHPLSFIDDPTRILRAVRFKERYNFNIEQVTFKHLKESLKLGMLEKVQPQRLRDELILLLKEKNPEKCIKRLVELRAVGFIKDGLRFSKPQALFFQAIKKEIAWFSKNLSHRRRLDTWLVYFIGLLDQFKTQEVKRICKKFVFRKGEEKRILCFKMYEKKIANGLRKPKITASGVFKILEPLSYEVIILLKAKYRYTILNKQIEKFLTQYNGMHIHIRGDDLSRLGIAPGPDYQKIFSRIISARLDGRVKTKEDELILAKRLSG